MNKRLLWLLLVPAFTAMAYLAPVSYAEVEGTDGFSVTANESALNLEGTIDVDTSLNIRTGPWATIIGGFRNGDKVQILSKEGDWFKIAHGDSTAYIHSYYVNAPGYPSHQGVEPPDGLGSNQSPDGQSSAAAATAGGGSFGGAPCDPMPESSSDEYGPRDIGIGSTFHEGMDLPIPNGTALMALGDGVVTESGWADGGGNFVRIQYDNGYSSLYYHLESVSVSEGQRVSTGQGVGSSDNTGAWTTGPHLHMGIFDSSGSSVNPRDVPGLVLPPLAG